MPTEPTLAQLLADCGSVLNALMGQESTKIIAEKFFIISLVNPPNHKARLSRGAQPAGGKSLSVAFAQEEPVLGSARTVCYYKIQIV
jgi:hypothetical protein